ncbi:MAG: MBOAT family protein [Eggerthellaceae bacterium]|nr:MBOAT family protein [Eggerthellaceae bacterium]
MLFSSITFLFYFLPVVLALYFVVPAQLKNPVLLAASLAFYAWSGIQYALLMLVLITIGWAFGLGIERARCNGEQPRVLLAVALACTLAALVYFKYADFAIESLNFVAGTSVPLLNVALPIGISFYTFQLMSYLVDVYRGEPAQRNWLTLATYIAMFPQLVAGPIVRYTDIARQLVDRHHTLEQASQGARRFVIGLAKKVLIANQLSELCAAFRASDDLSVLYYWLYAIAFALCIYFDFSGYSDMAIGLGKIFGFTFRENFDHPYTSTSATEFWRRWHISLGSWFRDYVYIPLGGNRVSMPRWTLNVLAVWLLTGIWHGAAWNFALWGLYFAVLLVVEKLWLRKHLERHRTLAHAYLLLAVLVSFVIFNADGLAGAASDLAGMIGLNFAEGTANAATALPLVSAEALYYLRCYAVVIIMAVVGATPVVKNAACRLEKRLEASPAGTRALAALEPLLLAALLLLCTAYLVDGSFNPFLYFRF